MIHPPGSCGLVASVAVLTWVLAPGTAVADRQARVDVKRPALLTSEGAAVVRVAARCEPGLEVLEAMVTVSQDVAFGDAPLAVNCDGSWHRLRVRVVSLDAPLQRGRAQVSAFLLLVIDPATGDTVSAQDTERLKLRPLRS
jgi:hypothetical protein